MDDVNIGLGGNITTTDAVLLVLGANRALVETLGKTETLALGALF
jgi:hypothetical protein